LSTVTFTAADTVVFPAASRARAVTACGPLLAVVVFHVTEYGEVVSSAPSAAPSNRNCTPATATLSAAVAVTVVAVPCTVVPVAGAVTATVGAVVSGVAVTVNENVVVCVFAPAVPVTVIVDVASGVVLVVVMVSVAVQGGVQTGWSYDAVAPAGNPLVVSVTACGVPATTLTVIALLVDAPCATDLFPPLLIAKSKATAGVVTLTGGADGADSFPAAS
jgi:hypothetical protein